LAKPTAKGFTAAYRPPLQFAAGVGSGLVFMSAHAVLTVFTSGRIQPAFFGNSSDEVGALERFSLAGYALGSGLGVFITGRSMNFTAFTLSMTGSLGTIWLCYHLMENNPHSDAANILFLAAPPLIATLLNQLAQPRIVSNPDPGLAFDKRYPDQREFSRLAITNSEISRPAEFIIFQISF
jgi:hypothetical protein